MSDPCKIEAILGPSLPDNFNNLKCGVNPTIVLNMKSEEEEVEEDSLLFPAFVNTLLGVYPKGDFTTDEQDVCNMTLDEYFKYKHQLGIQRRKQKMEAFCDVIVIAKTFEDVEKLTELLEEKEEQDGEDRFLEIRERTQILQNQWSHDRRGECETPPNNGKNGSKYVKVRTPIGLDEEDTSLYFPQLVRSRRGTPILNTGTNATSEIRNMRRFSQTSDKGDNDGQLETTTAHSRHVHNNSNRFSWWRRILSRFRFNRT